MPGAAVAAIEKALPLRLAPTLGQVDERVLQRVEVTCDDMRSVRRAVDEISSRHRQANRAGIGVDRSTAVASSCESRRYGELTMQTGEARAIIIGTAESLQINQNALGIQLTGEMQVRIEEAVEGADAVTLKRILKEWIPQAFLGAWLRTLLSMLGL